MNNNDPSSIRPLSPEEEREAKRQQQKKTAAYAVTLLGGASIILALWWGLRSEAKAEAGRPTYEQARALSGAKFLEGLKSEDQERVISTLTGYGDFFFSFQAKDADTETAIFKLVEAHAFSDNPRVRFAAYRFLANQRFVLPAPERHHSIKPGMPF